MRRLLGALCAAVLLLAPGAAWGDPVIQPPQGSVVGAPVQSVRVAVGAPVEPDLARARVTAPDGSSASLVRVTPADPEALVIPVPAGGRGTYRVAWWGLTTDGHPFAGTTSFAVGIASPAAVAVAPEGKDGAGQPPTGGGASLQGGESHEGAGWGSKTERIYRLDPLLTMLQGSPETGTRVRVGNADFATSPERRWLFAEHHAGELSTLSELRSEHGRQDSSPPRRPEEDPDVPYRHC